MPVKTLFCRVYTLPSAVLSNTSGPTQGLRFCTVAFLIRPCTAHIFMNTMCCRFTDIRAAAKHQRNLMNPCPLHGPCPCPCPGL